MDCGRRLKPGRRDQRVAEARQMPVPQRQMREPAREQPIRTRNSEHSTTWRGVHCVPRPGGPCRITFSRRSTKPLEGIGEAVQPEHAKARGGPFGRGRPDRETATPSSPARAFEHGVSRAGETEPEPPARGKSIEMDMSL